MSATIQIRTIGNSLTFFPLFPREVKDQSATAVSRAKEELLESIKTAGAFEIDSKTSCAYDVAIKKHHANACICTVIYTSLDLCILY